MGKEHTANAEPCWIAVSNTPDFCIVNGKVVVAFKIISPLNNERSGYTGKLRARGVPCLTTKSVIPGVVGNMGKGVASTVSLGSGDVALMTGAEKVYAEGAALCRNNDVCLMNVKSA